MPNPKPQVNTPDEFRLPHAPSGWRPVFFDYLYLGLTNSIALTVWVPSRASSPWIRR